MENFSKSLKTTRRQLLQSGAAVTAAALVGCSGISPLSSMTVFSSNNKTGADFKKNWGNDLDRLFLGGDVWANPMEEWHVVDGKAVARTGRSKANIQLLTHQLTNPNATFKTSTKMTRSGKGKDGGAGFRIGVRADINEFRANTFATNGITAGLYNNTLAIGQASAKLTAIASDNEYILTLSSQSLSEETAELTLIATNNTGAVLGTVKAMIPSEALLGNIALVHNFALKGAQKKSKKNNIKGSQSGVRYAFHEWKVSGDALTHTPSQHFGPIMWSMYAMSDSRTDEGHVFKMSVLTAPMGAEDSRDIELQIQKDDKWLSLGTAELDTDAWVAVFRIANWDASIDYPYRTIYKTKNNDNTETPYEWTGNIQAEPRGRPLRIAALTCQKDYGFPYAPVADNVAAMDPDLVYFSGDQLYESHGGFGLVRDPADAAITNYLRKYYMHGWSFREVMRNAPTLCIPDDHDIFQGNYWGEGGMKMSEESAKRKSGTAQSGGYREAPRMVNAVHRTCVAHHPDFYDPTPALQGISVYYGDMVYANVGFAILSDRQFKSGPEHVDTGGGRDDHVADPNFDTRAIDKPGLQFLGERQEAFLTSWASDWRGHEMKVLLSQTLFANTATHHGPEYMHLKGDLDSGGWPQTGRDKAIDIIRSSKCLHINGDQHLTSLVQYGVNEQRDSNWSFCTPAIAAGYPRWWHPDDVNMPHKNRPAHGLPQTGEYKDGFDNMVYVYAVGYPEHESLKNRYDVAHQKGSGFGFVTVDTSKKNYYIESFRFLIDVNDKPENNQFEGWPLTLNMDGELIPGKV